MVTGSDIGPRVVPGYFKTLIESATQRFEQVFLPNDCRDFRRLFG